MATPAEQALSLTNRLFGELAQRRPDIQKAYEYLDGKQPLVFATDEWRDFHADRYAGFSDNWTEVVAQAPVDRLRIDGFRASSSAESLTDDEKQLWSDWQVNELGAQSNQGFLASTVAKRSFTLVWGDDDSNPEVSWERPDQVIVAYSATGRRRVAALKAWMDPDAEREYATLYQADAVWKWERATVGADLVRAGFQLPSSLMGQGGWVPRETPGEPWPVPNPLGVVPVVEWPNRPRLGADPLSDVAGVMAMQDAVNLMWGYLFSSADWASMPGRVVTGSEPPKVPILDETGQIVGSRPAKMDDVAKKRILFLPGSGIDVKQWDAAKLDVFLGVVSELVGHIAAQTRTPGHYLLSNEKFANLNGDALTAAEVPLATKCENAQIHYGPAAKETAALMALVRDKKAFAQEIRESDAARFVQWKDPAMHSLSQVADAATKDRAVGMSLRTVLERRYGFTEPEIEQELQRVAAEATDPTLDRIAQGLLNVGDTAALGG